MDQLSSRPLSTACMRFTEDNDTIEYARRQWEDGNDRLARVDHESHKRAVMEEVIEGILDEIERRVGQSFDTLDLIDAYTGADTWALPVTHRVAPETAWAWTLDVVLDVAFFRYSRRARDWGMIEL